MESLFSWLAILISQQDSRHSFFYAYIYFCTLGDAANLLI
ncbi:hypothetical protein FORC64_3015 [Escherichia coli]|nr:hypothetical protein FORC64_3015 [Escherichia coli]